MKYLQWCLLVCFALCLCSESSSALQSSDRAAQREAIVATAERFAKVVWTAEERHFFHGEDESGVRVDTPDVELDASGFKVGAGNVGMPYCWGGFTSLESFESELAADRWAGHVPQQGNARGSAKTIGVDCSGLVSRCWNLPMKQSTRSLGALCYELDDYEDLLPGDIVNRFDAHVALFTGWVDESHTEIRVIEAARMKVEAGTYLVSVLRANDFLPMRYKPLDDRWLPMPKLDRPATPKVDRYLSDFKAQRIENLLSSKFLKGETKAGEWVAYNATEGGQANGKASVLWMAAQSDLESLVLQRRLEIGKGQLDTGATVRLDESWIELILAFGSFPQVFQDLKVKSSSTSVGTFFYDGGKLSARRQVASITGNMLSRSTLYPIALEVVIVASDEVPLMGICSAEYKLEINYGKSGEGPAIGTDKRAYWLSAFETK